MQSLAEHIQFWASKFSFWQVFEKNLAFDRQSSTLRNNPFFCRNIQFLADKPNFKQQNFFFTKKAFADISNVRQINPCFRQRHPGFDTRIQFWSEKFSFWQTELFFCRTIQFCAEHPVFGRTNTVGRTTQAQGPRKVQVDLSSSQLDPVVLVWGLWHNFFRTNSIYPFACKTSPSFGSELAPLQESEQSRVLSWAFL